mmetsp:Transcript_6651/g.9568  ORF Transcript_6651/g.9568 Transcript_6651/m.9568 type:complete len:258 (-) Transcript_6651:166-939(-)
MFEYNLIVPAALTAIYLLVFVRLMGDQVECPLLEEVAPTLNMEELIASFEGDKTNVNTAKAMQNRFCAIMGEHAQGAEIALQVGSSYSKTNPSHFSIMPETFSRGVSLYAMARALKNRRWQVEARKVHKIIRKWSRDGNPNVVHYESLLNAEKSVLKGKYDLAEQYYRTSRDAALQRCARIDAAMATERHGEFLINQRGKTKEGIRVFQEAIDLYKETGAFAKVNQMECKYRHLCPRPQEITMPIISGITSIVTPTD